MGGTSKRVSRLISDGICHFVGSARQAAAEPRWDVIVWNSKEQQSWKSRIYKPLEDLRSNYIQIGKNFREFMVTGGKACLCPSMDKWIKR